MKNNNTEEEFYRVQEEYFERFNDTFPAFCVRYLGEEEIIKMIKKCLDDNKPTDICDEPNVIY